MIKITELPGGKDPTSHGWACLELTVGVLRLWSLVCQGVSRQKNLQFRWCSGLESLYSLVLWHQSHVLQWPTLSFLVLLYTWDSSPVKGSWLKTHQFGISVFTCLDFFGLSDFRVFYCNDRPLVSWLYHYLISLASVTSVFYCNDQPLVSWLYHYIQGSSPVKGSRLKNHQFGVSVFTCIDFFGVSDLRFFSCNDQPLVSWLYCTSTHKTHHQ